MEIIRLDSVDSTNTYINRHISEFDGRDVVVVAHNQTCGRGNGTNSWHSEAGANLCFSILTHPTFLQSTSSFLISQAGALALCDALKAWLPSERIKIKWPNDIYIVPERLKLSGTLIETSMAAGALQTAIVGIGLNVNETQFPPTLPNPVSMAQVTGTELDKEEVFLSILNEFGKYYNMLKAGEHEQIRRLYHKQLFLLGEPSCFEDSAGIFTATITGIDAMGQLLLTDSGGMQRKYGFKEIKFKF